MNIATLGKAGKLRKPYLKDRYISKFYEFFHCCRKWLSSIKVLSSAN